MKQALLLAGMLLAFSCSDEGGTAVGGSEAISDREIELNVREALAGASDLPEALDVSVTDGVVSIMGSLECPDCGGNRTPAALGTIQQSLGAVMRAVPGVKDVQFTFPVGISSDQ